MLARLYSKSFKLGFNNTWAKNFKRYKLDLEKAEEPEIKLPTYAGSQKKQRNFEKSSTSVSLTMLKPLTVWITKNCGIFLMRWEYQTTLPASWETYMQDNRILHGIMDRFKIGKGVCQGCILSLCLFNLYAEYIMRNTGLMKHKLELRLPGEISINSYMQMIPHLGRKWRTKEPLDESERRVKKLT